MTKATSNDQYDLVLLSDKESIDFTRRQNSLAWRGLLTAEQYMDRENVLGKSKITSLNDNRLFIFMMVEKDRPEVKLALIEFLRRKLWIFVRNSDGKVEKKDIFSGCIGGVFTYPEARGRGIAKIMVDKLVERAKDSILGPDGFITLYSEIGEYYVRNGFTSFEVPLIELDLTKTSSVSSSELVVSPIKYHEFGNEFKWYEQKVELDMISKTSKDGKTRVCIVPNQDLVDWFHLRAKFIASKLFFPDDFNFEIGDQSYDTITKKFNEIEPEIFGLSAKDANGNDIGTISWTYDWSPENEGSVAENEIGSSSYFTKVTVLSVFLHDKTVGESSGAKLLVQELIRYLKQGEHAKFQNFKKLVIWESDVTKDVVEWLNVDLGAKIGLSNSSRSAIQLNTKVENDKMLSGDLIWELNNKLVWF